MTAEPIAAVVADIRRGRVRSAIKDPVLDRVALRRARRLQPVVNATAIYTSLTAKDTPIDVYGDHPCIAPPWDDAMFAYVNQHRNVIIMQVTAQPWPVGERWDTPNVVAWDELRWLLDVFIWVGGRDGTGRAGPTTGPAHLFRYAVMPNGAPADLHYVQLMRGYPAENWDMAQLTLLASLNFLACKNVDLVEPKRAFPVRRRLARTGVVVQEIAVRPVSKRTRSRTAGPVGEGEAVPLSSVRGTFHHYGPQYGKGLLFGKLAGQFWVPAHARGVKTGEDAEPRGYVLKP